MFDAFIGYHITYFCDGLFAGFLGKCFVEGVKDVNEFVVFSLKIDDFLFKFGYFG